MSDNEKEVVVNSLDEKIYSKKDLRKAKIFTFLYTSLIILSILCLIFNIFVYKIFYSNSGNYDANVLKYLNIIKLYEENYVSDIDMQKAIDYSILGLVESMGDKYGGYVSANNEMKTSQIVSGNYYGIGVTLNFQETYLEIVDIVEDSPAGRSELKIGDCITKINDKDVTIEVYEDFREELNKKIISEVKFEINRERDIVISLGEVKSEKVSYLIDNDVAYIHISRFVMDTVSEFKDAIDVAVKENVSKIVFDLRGNTGGNVDAVCEMLDYILDDCLLIDMQYANGENEQIYSDSNSVLKDDLVIQILADSESASASELFIMVLQDNYGVELIGQTTYGKSTVLKYFTFKDGSFLAMSSGIYYSSSGRYIEGIGLNPDIVLSDEEIGLSFEELRKLEILN